MRIQNLFSCVDNSVLSVIFQGRNPWPPGTSSCILKKKTHDDVSSHRTRNQNISISALIMPLTRNLANNSMS